MYGRFLTTMYGRFLTTIYGMFLTTIYMFLTTIYGRFLTTIYSRFLTTMYGRFLTTMYGRFLTTMYGGFLTTIYGSFLTTIYGRFLTFVICFASCIWPAIYMPNLFCFSFYGIGLSIIRMVMVSYFQLRYRQRYWLIVLLHFYLVIVVQWCHLVTKMLINIDSCNRLFSDVMKPLP